MKEQRLSKRVELLKRRGFFRIFFKGNLHDINVEDISPKKKDEIRVLIDRFKIVKEELRNRLSDAIEVTFKEGENRLILINSDTGEQTEFNKFYECCGSRYEEPEPRFFLSIILLELALFVRDSARRLG
ncbi:MAG: hypothetical protein MZV64_02975 [Ignavibacteriales bacterium]|nr:hypothetical protein [Ignavibacteriales bacterium]